MKAVLMAGGEGSRLRPLTVGRPKPMVPIINKPVMGHILDLLKSHGITEIIVTVRYLATYIQDFFEDGKILGVQLTYVVEETPLGTAGSVKNAAEFLNETFLVISGDALTDFNLREIVQVHGARGAEASLTLARVADPLEYGVIITDEQARVKQFQEKPSWGELISDTVNTGIYVLEPSVLNLIPTGTAYDFSTELFPKMLLEGRELYGYVADGYWCDVGTLEEYRRANNDLLYGNVKTHEPIGQHLGGGIYAGVDVEISPSAQLFGPIYLGHGVKIKGDVTIYGPSVIRDYSIIDAYSRLERTIIWRNTYVGENCELRGAIISRQCSIKAKVVAYEGAVVSDSCTVGEGSVLHADVKLWPRKEVEPGTIVKDSIIWGHQGRRSLFGRNGITGVVNVDLTPEFAAKLGAAIGATLPKGSHIAINRDAHRSSRMLKRALISGIPGTGNHVLDMGTTAIPIVRHHIRTNPKISAGIHVRLSPFDQRVVDIRIIEASSMNQSKAEERTIERTFFREDFRRAYLDEIGTIQYGIGALESYTEDFLANINVARIRDFGFHIILDYSHGLTADPLAQLLNTLGVEVVPLNARMDETKLAMLHQQFHANLERVAKIVDVLDANLGIQLDVGGEKVFLVDETGEILDDMITALLMVELTLYANPGATIAIPVTMPSSFDTVAEWHGGTILRISNDMHSLMQTASNAEILLIADGIGNFIFPGFQPAVDGMMATVRLLEFLAVRELTVSTIVDYLPVSHIAHELIHCPTVSKGKVMRRLNERYANEARENINGIKISFDGGDWIHIAPDPEQPHFLITAEAQSDERAHELAQQQHAVIEQILATTTE